MSDTHELRHRVREFLDEERNIGTILGRPDSWLSGYDRAFSRRLADHDWVGMTFPRRWGGHGRSAVERYAVLEELLVAGAPVSALWVSDRQAGPSILRNGSDSQRERYIPGIVNGDIGFAIGMSEQESGSDLASVRTTATRTPGGWVLNGTKLWTGGAHLGDVVLVLARTTSSENKHEGLSQFLVDLRTPGIRIEPIRFLNGEHRFNATYFDHVELPAESLLGAEGEGWRQVTAELASERSGPERFLTTAPLLTGLLATDPTLSAPQEREIGELIARLAALRQMSFTIARSLDDDRSPDSAAAVVKGLGTTFEGEVIDTVSRLGPPADPSATPGSLPELLAFAIAHRPSYTLRGGTTEILRSIITKQVASVLPQREAYTTLFTEPPGFDPLRAQDLAALSSEWRRAATEVPPEIAAVDVARAAGYRFAVGPIAQEAVHQHTATHQADSTGPSRSPVIVAAPALQVQWAEPSTESRIGPPGTAGRSPALIVSGSVQNVPWLEQTPRLTIVANGPAGAFAFTVEPARATRSSGRNLAGAPVGTLHLAGHTVPEPFPVSEGLLSRIQLDTCIADAAYAAGAARRACDMTVEHVFTREQFGRPLAAFQAVKQQLAVLIEDTCLLDAAVDLAANNADDDIAVASATAVVSILASKISTVAHQLHGAVGFTERSQLRLATMPLLALQHSDHGAAAEWIGRETIRAGADWWPLLAHLTL